jgi:hypothetical protein
MIANIGGHWVNPAEVVRLREAGTESQCFLCLSNGADLIVNLTRQEAADIIDEAQIKHALKTWEQWYKMPLQSPFKSAVPKDCYEEVSP